MYIELVKLKFTFITVLKYKAGPGFDDQLEHPPVQIFISPSIGSTFSTVVLEILGVLICFMN